MDACAVSALITLTYTLTMKESPMNYYQPSVVDILTLDEVHATEPAMQPTLLEILQAHGHERFEAPIVAQRCQADFPALFPTASSHESPVVVVCLPNRMKYDLEELARSPLFPMQVPSRDLMELKTCLVAVGRDNELYLDAEKMIQTVRGVGEWGLHLLFICNGQLWVVKHPLDNHWSVGVVDLMESSGKNYCPQRSYTEAELAAAAAKSLDDSMGHDTTAIWHPEVVYKATADSGT
jgi:hypothetical protein